VQADSSQADLWTAFDGAWECGPHLNDNDSWLTFVLRQSGSQDALHAWSFPGSEQVVLKQFRALKSGEDIEIPVELIWFELDGEIHEEWTNGLGQAAIRQSPVDGGPQATLALTIDEAAAFVSWTISDPGEPVFRLLRFLCLLAPGSFVALARDLRPAMDFVGNALVHSLCARQSRPCVKLDPAEFIWRFRNRETTIWANELQRYFEMKWATLKKHLVGAGLVSENALLQGWSTSVARILDEFVPYVRNLPRASQVLHEFLDVLEDAGACDRPR